MKITTQNYFLYAFIFVDLDNPVGIATCYGIESQWEARYSVPVQTDTGAHLASYTIDTGSFPGVKRPGSGVNHSPSSNAEVKERGGYTSTPHLGFRGLF